MIKGGIMLARVAKHHPKGASANLRAAENILYAQYRHSTTNTLVQVCRQTHGCIQQEHNNSDTKSRHTQQACRKRTAQRYDARDWSARTSASSSRRHPCCLAWPKDHGSVHRHALRSLNSADGSGVKGDCRRTMQTAACLRIPVKFSCVLYFQSET